MHASTAIFYNHESPRRNTDFVTRKITNGAARIAEGKQDKLVLGDLTAKIDWGHAREYMEAAWSIVQQPDPGDFVIATGEAHSIQDFVDETFRQAGLDVARHVDQDQSLFRPTKTGVLVGDSSKAKAAFGFDPKIRMHGLVKAMLDHDMAQEKG